MYFILLSGMHDKYAFGSKLFRGDLVPLNSILNHRRTEALSRTSKPIHCMVIQTNQVWCRILTIDEKRWSLIDARGCPKGMIKV